MDKLWEPLFKYGPWTLLAFLLLFGLYKTFVPAIIKLLDGFLEHLKATDKAKMDMMEKHLERVEASRLEQEKRHDESVDRRDRLTSEFQSKQLEAMALQTDTIGKLANEVRSINERLPPPRK